MSGYVVEAHGLGFDSYYWLNALDYPVLVVVDVVSTLKFDSPWRVHRAWPWKVPWLSKKKKKKKVQYSKTECIFHIHHITKFLWKLLTS